MTAYIRKYRYGELSYIEITTIHSPACGKDFIFSRGRTVVCVSPEDLVNVSVSTFQTLVYILGCKLLELAIAVLELLPR